MRWRCVGTKKAVVGRCRRRASSALAASKRRRMASEPPESNVPGREADGDGVVHRRAHQMEVGPVEVPHRGLVLEHGAGGRLVPQPGGHALGPPRGTRGVVHRAGQWVRGELGRRAVGQRGQRGLVEDAQNRVGILGQEIALDVGEGGIEQHRDQPDPGRAENGADEVGRRAEGEGHPVTPGATPGQERAGRTALADLGVGGLEDLDAGGTARGHRRTVGPAPRRRLRASIDLPWPNPIPRLRRRTGLTRYRPSWHGPVPSRVGPGASWC